jgi:TetR/AcrR family transcriptional repressor of nem operon
MSPRRKQFEPEEALDAAMHLFWWKGFESTTMQELVDEMGINRFSMYDTFGDKHELFLSSLRRYNELMSSARVRALDEAQSGLAGIREHFRAMERWYNQEEGQAGCLVTNTIVEKGPHDEEAHELCAHLLENLEGAFSRALRRARRDGEIQTRENLRDLARYLVGVHQALNVLARAGAGARELRGIVRIALSAVR